MTHITSQSGKLLRFWTIDLAHMQLNPPLIESAETSQPSSTSNATEDREESTSDLLPMLTLWKECLCFQLT